MTSRYLSSMFARFGIAVLLSSVAINVYAQEVTNPIGEFLVAFRGKPVGPVIVPPSGSPSINTPRMSASSANLTTTASTQTNSSVNTPYCPPGMTSGPTGCVPMAMPPNAHRISDDGQWQCDDGFMRLGPVCTAIQSTPQNAHLTGIGTNWECNTGFRRLGNECVAVNVPPNAHIADTWSGWACDSGYRPVGNWCFAN
jgi:hypothetical protein